MELPDFWQVLASLCGAAGGGLVVCSACGLSLTGEEDLSREICDDVLPSLLAVRIEAYFCNRHTAAAS